MKGEIFDEYVRVKKPNKDLLAEIVLRAKGDGRSVAQFAKECGVSPSTLCRLLNKENKRPNTDRLIDSIYRNAAPESGVTLEELLEAHGMVPALRNGRTKRSEKGIYEKDFESIIVSEIVSRGYQVALSKLNLVYDALNYKYSTDLAIETNALSNTENMLWQFEFWTLEHLSKIGEQDIQKQVKKIRQKILMFLGMIYSDELNVGKISYVVSEKRVYEKLVESLKEKALPTQMSIIYINLKAKIIELEYQIPIKGQQLDKSIFEDSKL